MTNVTEVLGNESGIQYQGVNDASGGTGSYPTIGLIVGRFRRGRTDKPMTVTNSNIRALLGYEPENMDYANVQDVLDSGVPSVQVLRVIPLSDDCEPSLLTVVDRSTEEMWGEFYLTYDLSIPALGINLQGEYVHYSTSRDGDAGCSEIFRSLFWKISQKYDLSEEFSLIKSMGSGGVSYFKTLDINYGDRLHGITGATGEFEKGGATITLKPSSDDIDGGDILNLLSRPNSTVPLLDEAPIVLHSCGLDTVPAY